MQPLTGPQDKQNARIAISTCLTMIVIALTIFAACGVLVLYALSR